jgi:hypothetical protein
VTVDWEAYQACTETCGAPLGKPCRSLSGYVVLGDVTIAEEAAEPHTTRKLRAESARTGGNRG